MANRTRLKYELFYNGACPDASAYAEIFDTTLNFDDDGIIAPGNQKNINERDNPLTIIGRGMSKNVLKFITKNESINSEWMIQLENKTLAFISENAVEFKKTILKINNEKIEMFKNDRIDQCFLKIDPVANEIYITKMNAFQVIDKISLLESLKNMYAKITELETRVSSLEK